MRLDRVLMAAGVAALGLGTVLANPALAGATFPGSQNGNVDFIAICDGNIGQATYSLNPNGTPPPTYTCPGGAAPNYTQTSAGSIDSMPYYSAAGTTLYFSSNRGGNYSVYSVPYPDTITGTAGSQLDGATQLTTPASTSNDFAPTVDQNGNILAFIRCDSAGTTCNLYTQSPIVGGTPTLVPTSQLLAVPDSVSGAADRPEIDPVDPTKIIYTGVDGHIHLVSLTGAFAERDLSVESGIGAGQADEYPDWKPDGTAIILDSDRNTGHKVFILNVTTNPATITSLWGASDPGTEIEPIYSPTGAEYVWTKLGSGSNLQLDMGTIVGKASILVNLTNNKTNNSQPTWQPVSIGTILPEAPYAVLLPGGALLILGLAFGVRRRRQPRRPLVTAAG